MYAKVALYVFEVIKTNHKNIPGLYPTELNTKTGDFISQEVSLGAYGDSFFEYLVKVWLLTGKQDDELKHMFQESYDAILDHMIAKAGNLYYLPKLQTYAHQSSTLMEHLACFTGAMFALASNYGYIH